MPVRINFLVIMDDQIHIDLDLLRNNQFVESFAVCGELIAIKYSHTIFVYKNVTEYLWLKKRECVRFDIKYIGEDGANDCSFPIALFQANVAGWNYALGFIRQFGGEGIRIIHTRK